MSNDTFNEILNRETTMTVRDLAVQKDSTQESTQTKDVNALSGGERSFMTLAFLLALGKPVSNSLLSPHRRVYVFFDPAACKIALDNLAARWPKLVHHQSIFIIVSVGPPSRRLAFLRSRGCVRGAWWLMSL